ncbi:MAG: hypothetical protein EXS64_21015 [Candidatus Latescibacteria bacterium]|nr:hypothetical protein [Candidatus Latescibacterota bacterium]
MKYSQRQIEAAKEKKRRQQTRRSLTDFTRYTHPGYEPAPHHRLIAERLEAVAEGRITRLMLFLPPRHGKSELASRRFPAWYLGQYPGRQIICASYGSELAADFGREVRNLVASPEYGRLFDVQLRPDSKAADRWNTAQGGVYVAAGIGAAITGRGAHVALIDDPLKNREEADSATIRDRAWEWYRSTLYTRLMPGGAIVLIQTRWHEDDLAGRLLEAQRQGGDRWEIVSLPALAEEDDPLGRQPGEALWPQWYPAPVLEQTRAVIGPREWSALYQQRPQADTGEYFKREWVRWYDERPAHMRIYGASDYAVTANGGDYTVHIVAGITPNDDLCILDLWRKRASSDVWVEAFLDLVERWKPVKWAEESGQIEKSLGPFILKRAQERRVYCNREQFTSTSDKPTRARAFQARMAMGKVYFPRSAPWSADLLDELVRFPTGAHDDQVDALSLFGRMLDEMYRGAVPHREKRTMVFENGSLRVSPDFIMEQVRQMAEERRRRDY